MGALVYHKNTPKTHMLRGSCWSTASVSRCHGAVGGVLFIVTDIQRVALVPLGEVGLIPITAFGIIEVMG